jgi:hypothetical protein
LRAISVALSPGKRPMRRSRERSRRTPLRKLACDANLGMKASEQLLVLRGGCGKELQRDWPAQLQIDGAVNFANAALAEESKNAVALQEHDAGRESAFVQGTGRNECAGWRHHSRGRRACRS